HMRVYGRTPDRCLQETAPARCRVVAAQFQFCRASSCPYACFAPSQLLQQCLCSTFKGGSALTRKALTVLEIPYKSSKFFRSAVLEHRWLYFVANLEGIQESLLSRDAATASCTGHQGSL